MRLRPITRATGTPGDASARQRRLARSLGRDRPAARRRPSRAASPRMVRAMRREARAGRQLPFVVEYDGRFVGQLTVSNIVRGSAQFASIGYWIDETYAGRGIITRAVAMAIDHCFGPVGLHRIEVAIRPENTSSLRVVEKLGIQEVGYAPRFLHIDGDWRDHGLFAITREEVPAGAGAPPRSPLGRRRFTPVTGVISRHTGTGPFHVAEFRSYRQRRGPVSSHLRGARPRVGRLPDPQGAQAPRRDGERPPGRGPLRAGADPAAGAAAAEVAEAVTAAEAAPRRGLRPGTRPGGGDPRGRPGRCTRAVASRSQQRRPSSSPGARRAVARPGRRRRR